MTRINKTNKRSVRKATAVFEPETTEIAKPRASVLWEDMSYKELQVEAKRCGLKANGSKADLIERLA